MTIDAIMPGARVLCAVSGGVDSMYLLHRMTALGAQRGFAVGCAHFNHGLRGAESDRDEAFVRAQCEKLGVPFYAGRGDVASVRGMGTEAAARELRYAFLAQCAQAHSYDWIATAHTADDNAETLLLNLARGCGLRGLTGIPPQRDKLLRPMLDTTRAQAEAYLTAHAIPHVEDSTNVADAYARNRVRHGMVPALESVNPAFVQHAADTAALLREDEAFLSGLAADFLAGQMPAEGIPIAELLALPQRPTCIFLTDDVSALGGLAAIARAGLRVPEDISAVGYDGIPLAKMMIPSLTTYHQDTQAIGYWAADRLVSLIEHPKTTLPESILIPGSLLEGASVRRI